MVDLLSNALNAVKVAELNGKKLCSVPNSKLIRAVFNALIAGGYLTSVEEDERKLKVVLNGSVNNCGAVRPRFFVKFSELENFENKYLPSKGVGSLIVSTSKGVITNEEAKKKHIGGKLLAFIY